MKELTTYLLTDISSAHKTNDFIEETMEQTIDEYFAEIENYLNGFNSGRTFSYYCGLESQYFPPADFFSKQELTLICKAFEEMMFSWNLGISYPENLPIDLVYDAIIKTLDTETAIVNSGFLHFDYCSGYAPDCIWKEHCSCLVYWNSNENDLDDNKEGDF